MASWPPPKLRGTIFMQSTAIVVLEKTEGMPLMGCRRRGYGYSQEKGDIEVSFQYQDKSYQLTKHHNLYPRQLEAWTALEGAQRQLIDLWLQCLQHLPSFSRLAGTGAGKGGAAVPATAPAATGSGDGSGGGDVREQPRRLPDKQAPLSPSSQLSKKAGRCGN